MLNIGLPNNYGEHGERNELLAECQLDVDGIRQQINEYLEETIESAEKLSVSY